MPQKFIKTLIAVFLVQWFFPAPITADDSVVVVRFTRTSDWVKMIEGVDYISPQEKERIRYQYGGARRPAYTTHTTLWLNDTASFYMDEAPAEGAGGYSWLRDPFLIRRNFETRQIHDVVTWQRSTLIIQDTLIFPQWKILNDIREIAGQICMNATFTDTVKGQQIVAWFSLSYPSFAGPERLSGLPGLILGVEVNNGALEIMAVSIDTVPLIHQLTMPDRFDGRRIRGEQITEESFRQKVQQYMAEQRKAGRFPFWGIRY